MKRFIIGILSAVLLAGVVPARAEAATTLYEYRETTMLARSVSYEFNRQITDAGMLDIHVLTVPLNDPAIVVNPVDSQKELGLKETALSLLSGAGAIAGVNGDFFGMAGSYSVPFGPVAVDGKLKAVTPYTNSTKDEFAALLIDPYSFPLMRYIKSTVQFLNNGKQTVEIGTYNKIGQDCEYPVIIDRQVMKDTLAVDRRFPGLSKIVVNDWRITYISLPGETVDIPADGYILILPASMSEYRSHFTIGEYAELRIGNNLGIDYDRIVTAIGGGGRVLANGKVVHDTGTAIAGRQPRTAVGVSADGKRLIIMAVDGRSHSIGATHNELASLLLRYGAYEAMHLDGGGSTTMVLREPDSGGYVVANTPSDGAQRRIINALGVFDRSEIGDMRQLGLKLSQEEAFIGSPVTLEPFGMDDYLHSFDLPPEAQVVFTARSDAEAGELQGDVYIPKREGVHTIDAIYEGFKAQITLTVHPIVELQCDTAVIRTISEQRIPLSFTGITADGEPVPADNAVTVQAVPPQLGTFEDGAFLPAATGAGYLACEVGGVYTYIPLSIGGQAGALYTFDKGEYTFTSYPSTVTGGLSEQSFENGPIVKMDYHFRQTNDTQAAYVTFEPAFVIGGSPIALQMNVLGNGSGHWLRGRIVDASGQTFTIDFCKSVDFTGWQYVTAMIPSEAQAPYSLERVYIASTDSDSEQLYSVSFTGMLGLYAPTLQVSVPNGQKFKDPLQQSLSSAQGSDLLDFVVPDNATYSAQTYQNTMVINLKASGGGIYAANASQWKSFTTDMNQTTADNIILLMDRDPRKFSQSKEFELFHKTMLQQKAMGKSVFVVSYNSETTGSEIKDGIRYINAASIRFQLGGKQALFDIGRLY